MDITKNRSTSFLVAVGWHIFFGVFYIFPEYFIGTFGNLGWVVYVTVLSLWSVAALFAFFYSVAVSCPQKWPLKVTVLHCCLLILPLYQLWVTYLNRLQR